MIQLRYIMNVTNTTSAANPSITNILIGLSEHIQKQDPEPGFNKVVLLVLVALVCLL